MNHPFPGVRLATLPMAAKVLVTCVLLTLGTGYLFAIANIFLRVGFTPEDVELHYYGNEASRRALEEMAAQAEADVETGIAEEETFSFDELEDTAVAVDESALVPIPTLDMLVAEGHFHLFGYTSIFVLCGLVLLLADMRREWLRILLIVAPFAASVLDIWSMLLTRFVRAEFSWLLMISGAVMAASFLLVFTIGIYQTWFFHPTQRPTP